jgi:PAS domain S-box-containing protein
MNRANTASQHSMSPGQATEPAELEARLRFETLIADLSSRFVNLPAGEVDREIMEAERRICEVLGLDISAIWQWSAGPPGHFTLTHYYSALDGPQPSMQLSDSDFPWFRQLMIEGRIVPISSLGQMPAEAALDRENCRRLGVKSNLCLPLTVAGEPVGILGLNTTRAERDWPDALVKRLQLLAQVFTHALARKRADEALRESEERMTLAAEAAEFGVWVWSLARDGVWGSERWLRLFGFASGEAISFEGIIQRIHPDDRETVEREVRRALAGGSDYVGEFRAVLPDGTQRWVASRGRGYPDGSGKPARMLGAAVDITERKRTEDQVRQLSLAVEQSPVSVLITDLQGNIIYVNRKFSEVSGYGREECIGQNPRLLKSGECPRSVYEELWSRITRGGTWQGEFHNRRKNGELYWEWAVISPLLNAAGKVTHFVGIKEDITERKRAEEALRASQARLAAGTELAGLGYFEVDYAGQTCFLDDRFREICGLPANLLQGLHPVQFWQENIHPDDRDYLQDVRQKLHAGRIDSISAEYRYLHPAKGQRWLHHSARVVGRSAGGGGIRTLGVVRDITELKRAEAEARDLSGRLLRAQEAERARIAKELHDGLSQNLALLSVELEMFGQRLPDSPEQINARLVEFSRHTKGLSAEVHRIAHGLHPAKLTQLGLEVALRGFCREMTTAHSMAVRFEARDVPRGLPEDVALCLYRVAQEAVQNVVKHSGAKQATVELAALGGALVLTITDDGQGFVMGTGRATGSLGLVSMHERVRLVQGEIAVQSQPGEGTRVEVRVPLPKETKP